MNLIFYILELYKSNKITHRQLSDPTESSLPMLSATGTGARCCDVLSVRTCTLVGRSVHRVVLGQLPQRSVTLKFSEVRVVVGVTRTVGHFPTELQSAASVFGAVAERGGLVRALQREAPWRCRDSFDLLLFFFFFLILGLLFLLFLLLGLLILFRLHSASVLLLLPLLILLVLASHPCTVRERPRILNSRNLIVGVLPVRSSSTSLPLSSDRI